jgi:mannosyltransferase OCH1-like enzyme
MFLFRFLVKLRMQYVIHCRIRTVFFASLTLFLLLSTYVAWPWFYAAWIWRKSTIDSIDYSIASTLNNSLTKVPAIIHQTWRDADTIPISWQQASNSCRSFHPNYEYRLWTDKDARILIEKEFPCLLSTFDSYPYDIQRADVIRLAILYVYGGIYLDLDIICLKSLDQLRSYPFVLPRTKPVGLSNDFIIAEPKHPFLLQVLNDLPNHHRNYLTK